MIITAMYIFGLTQNSWEFGWFSIMACLVADCIIVRILSPSVDIRIKNEISDDEKYYWN